MKRQSTYLTHEVFNKYHTETEMMRYIKRLDRKDISLAHSMISLGSCTMKLNAAAEMLPLSRPEFMNMHPLVPEDQAEGYRELISNLSEELKIITGFARQPATKLRCGRRICRTPRHPRLSGKHRARTPQQGADTGIRTRHQPGIRIQAGFTTVTCACDAQGNVDMPTCVPKRKKTRMTSPPDDYLPFHTRYL